MNLQLKTKLAAGVHSFVLFHFSRPPQYWNYNLRYQEVNQQDVLSTQVNSTQITRDSLCRGRANHHWELHRRQVAFLALTQFTSNTNPLQKTSLLCSSRMRPLCKLYMVCHNTRVTMAWSIIRNQCNHNENKRSPGTFSESYEQCLVPIDFEISASSYEALDVDSTMRVKSSAPYSSWPSPIQRFCQFSQRGRGACCLARGLLWQDEGV